MCRIGLNQKISTKLKKLSFDKYQINGTQKINFGITGGNGLIGNNLCVILKNNNIKFNKFTGNILNYSLLNEWIEVNNFDYIIHLAAKVPLHLTENDKKLTFDTNFLGTFNLVKSICKLKIKPVFFFASTSHVYDENFDGTKIDEVAPINPKSAYSLSKYLSEEFIKSELENFFIARIFSVFSAKQKSHFFYPSLLKQIELNAAKKEIEIINGLNVRDFIKPDQVTYWMISLLLEKSFGTFNLGSGLGLSLIEFAMNVAKFKNVNIHFKPKQVEKINYRISNNLKLMNLLNEF